MGIVSRSSSGGVGAVLFDSTLGADSGAGIDTGANGIAGGFRVLEAWVLARTDEAVTISSITITVNNDTGANYDAYRVIGAAAVVSSLGSTGLGGWLTHAAGASLAAGEYALVRLTILGYADVTAADKIAEQTAGFADTTAANDGGGVRWFSWRNTAAITRMKVVHGGGTVLKAGSRLLILGR